MNTLNNKRLLTVGNYSNAQTTGKPNIRIPILKLAGKWLKEAGFNSTDIVEVDVKYGSLIIRKTKHKWIEVFADRLMINEKGEPIKCI